MVHLCRSPVFRVEEELVFEGLLDPGIYDAESDLVEKVQTHSEKAREKGFGITKFIRDQKTFNNPDLIKRLRAQFTFTLKVGHALPAAWPLVSPLPSIASLSSRVAFARVSPNVTSDGRAGTKRDLHTATAFTHRTVPPTVARAPNGTPVPQPHLLGTSDGRARTKRDRHTATAFAHQTGSPMDAAHAPFLCDGKRCPTTSWVWFFP